MKPKLSTIVSVCLSAIIGAGVWCVTANVSPSAAVDDEAMDVATRRVLSNIPRADMSCEVYDITLATGKDIDNHVINFNKRAAGSYNYKDFDDEYALTKMNKSQVEYYRRLETVGYNYITSEAYDAYYVSAYNVYATNGIQYSDLGLSKTDAVNITEYFIYNNPQYYFFKPGLLSSSQAIYISCYSQFAKGSNRTDTTNSVFNEFDTLKKQVDKPNYTDYDKTLAAHDVVCKILDYKSGDYDQSVYSAIVQRKTVCAGYSELMAMLLNASGVDCTVVASQSHAWNVVKLNDVYYGLDATWDDSLGNYRYLAVSDVNLKKYDSNKEHTSVTPWSEFAPKPASYNYSNEAVSSSINIKSAAPVLRTMTYSANGARIYWDSIPYAVSYEYDLSKVSDFSTTFNANNNTKSTNITVNGMAAGKTYYGRVRSVCVIDGRTIRSDYSTIEFHCANAATSTKMTAPSLRSDRTGIASIRVSWNSVSNAKSYCYDLSKKSDFSTFVQKNKSVTNTYVDLNLDVNKDYYIRVKAVGNSQSSDYAKLKLRIDETKPSVPKLSAVLSNNKTIKMTFSTSDKSVRFLYKIYTSSNLSNSSIVADEVTKNTSATFDSTTPGKTYYIICWAYKDLGSGKRLYSNQSNIVNVIVPEKTTAQSLTKPTVSIKSYSILARINWANVAKAERYEYIAASDSSFKNVIDSGRTISTMTMISLNGVKSNNIYVKVRAVGSGTTSDWAIVSAKI